MRLNEIKGKSWKVSKDLKIIKSQEGTVDTFEQELHLNVLRCGISNPEFQEILVCCSNQLFITELSKSEYFILKSVTISDHPKNKDFVLQVDGILDNNGMTIRKKKQEFTEEERKIRAERARANFSK